jgi:hypothetical protein
VITDDEVMRLFERADPARTTDDLDNTPDTTGYLAALRQRSNNVTYIQPTDTPPDEPVRRPFTLMAIAAAAVVVLVVGALVLAARGDDEGREVPATVPPTVPGPKTTLAPTTPPSPSPVDDPVATAEAFLTTIEAGDPTEVEALQAPDFDSRQWLGPVHQAAMGAAYTDPNCRASSEEADRVIVLCTTSIELSAHRLTNTLGAPVSIAVTVGKAGVTAMDTSVNNLGLLPFESWKEANWPGGLPIEVDDITTVEGVVEHARVEAQLARDWAVAAVEAVEGSFADFNAGDVNAFTSRFDTEERFAPSDVVAALVAEGQQYLVTGCAADGIEPAGLAVVCDVVVRHGSFVTTGVEASGTLRVVVDDARTIARVANTIDVDSIGELRQAFEQWLLAAHPDVHDQITWVEVGEGRIPAAADQTLVATHYDEFVAQSDRYPLDA